MRVPVYHLDCRPVQRAGQGVMSKDIQDPYTSLVSCRQQRLAEIQKAVSKPRFGTVELIRGSEFVQKARISMCMCGALMEDRSCAGPAYMCTTAWPTCGMCNLVTPAPMHVCSVLVLHRQAYVVYTCCSNAV